MTDLKNSNKKFMKFSQTNNMTKRIGTTILTGATIMATFFGLPLLAQAATYTRQLDLGMSGADVTALQQFLASDSTTYPEGVVTGYYGSLTAAAVGRYQAKNGLASVGRVGPATLALLNGGSTVIGDVSLGYGDVSAPILQPESVITARTSVTMNWYTNEPATARVLYGTYWPFLFTNAPSVAGIGGASTYQTVTINDLAPNSTYYYVLQSTDASGNVNQTVGKPFSTTN